MRADRVIKRKLKIAEDKLVRSPAGRKLWMHGFNQGKNHGMRFMRDSITNAAFHLKYEVSN